VPGSPTPGGRPRAAPSRRRFGPQDPDKGDPAEGAARPVRRKAGAGDVLQPSAAIVTMEQRTGHDAGPKGAKRIVRKNIPSRRTL
jgi:hypothetical protein